jgi:hypothetical protein
MEYQGPHLALLAWATGIPKASVQELLLIDLPVVRHHRISEDAVSGSNTRLNLYQNCEKDQHAGRRTRPGNEPALLRALCVSAVIV